MMAAQDLRAAGTGATDPRQRKDGYSRRTFLGSAISASLISACSPSKAPLDKNRLTLQAAWVDDAEFIGYFVALARGYYRAEGIGVDYLSGGPDVIPESRLLSGRADIALTSIETTARVVSEQGAKFKVVGAQYQKTPLGVVSLASSHIREPKDLIGKTLACPSVNLVSVKAILAMHGVPESRVRLVPYQMDPTPLITGSIDASIDFTDDVPYAIQKAGKQPSFFLLYDAGFTIGGDFLVVDEERLALKRDAIVKFLRASRRGWVANFIDTTAYPEAFADSWLKGTGRGTDVETYFNGAQKALIESPDGIFSMSDEWIERNIDALGRVGVKAPRTMFDPSLLEDI